MTYGCSVKNLLLCSQCHRTHVELNGSVSDHCSLFSFTGRSRSLTLAIKFAKEIFNRYLIELSLTRGDGHGHQLGRRNWIDSNHDCRQVDSII